MAARSSVRIDTHFQQMIMSLFHLLLDFPLLVERDEEDRAVVLDLLVGFCSII